MRARRSPRHGRGRELLRVRRSRPARRARARAGRRIAAARREPGGRRVKLRIGTRGSALALAQARWVARQLAERGDEGELVVIRTAGDRDQTSPYAAVGAPGIFVREIEQALLERRIDVAVHSYKDLPSHSPAELAVVAVPEREDPRDVLVSRADGPARARRIGTSSARRRMLVTELHPGTEAVALRGNVPTRIDKLRRGEYDAIVLAAAGITRLARAGELELAGLRIDALDPRIYVPAPAQGALALQVRADDACAARVAALDRAEIAQPVRAEREFLRLADAGCDAVIGALAAPRAGGGFVLDALLERRGRLARARVEGAEPIALAADAFAR
ncbi:MAG: hydroxymethylbilane synthase, partial [Planctomycetota bacterium]